MPDTPEERLMTVLYEQHAAVLLAFVSRYTDNRSQAEDVVQETLLRAWRHLDRIDAAGNPRAYLMTVARNVLTDQWRAARSRPRVVGPVEEEWQAPGADDVDAALERWLVGEALAKLTPEHRAVVQSLYYEGRTVDETAAALGVPSGTVKSRSYYAVRALRTVFEEMGVVR